MDNEYPTITYFMEAYWNQTGDLVHGNLAGAARSFRSESEEYRQNLCNELVRALEDGLVAESMSWDDCGEFWRNFDRYLDRVDAETVLKELS